MHTTTHEEQHNTHHIAWSSSHTRVIIARATLSSSNQNILK